MSAYPDSIYSDRERANKPGFPYDPEDPYRTFKEDIEAWVAEIIAIEQDLVAKNSFHEIWLKPFAQNNIIIASGSIEDGIDTPSEQPDYPRQLDLSAFNLSGVDPCTCKVTIEGKDQDGNDIADVINIDLDPMEGEFYPTDHAYSKVITITKENTTGSGIYNLTVTDKFGVLHYPFSSEDKFYSYTIDNINTTMPALDLTYGLITLPADEIKNFGLWYKK
jgi:hypothetical protein